MTTSTSHAALWCKSNFSFLEGASHPEELIAGVHPTELSRPAADHAGDDGAAAVGAHAGAERGARLLPGVVSGLAVEGEAHLGEPVVRGRAVGRGIGDVFSARRLHLSAHAIPFVCPRAC